jgi:membrane-bound inhibitor of C-type lysozyme
MRNQKRLLRTIATSAALVTALMMVTAAQASAAVWSPGAHTATASGGGLTVQTQTSTYNCDATTMTMLSSATGAATLTQPVNNGVTFSNCYSSGLGGGQPVVMSMAGQWRITPTSTTTASVQLPVNGLKVVIGGPGYCTINIGPTTIDATWSAPIHRLRIHDTTVAHTSSGLGWCPGTANITVYNTTVNNMPAWTFPTFSII